MIRVVAILEGSHQHWCQWVKSRRCLAPKGVGAEPATPSVPNNDQQLNKRPFLDEPCTPKKGRRQSERPLKPQRGNEEPAVNNAEPDFSRRLSWRLQPKAAAAPKRGRGLGAELEARTGERDEEEMKPSLPGKSLFAPLTGEKPAPAKYIEALATLVVNTIPRLFDRIGDVLVPSH